MKIIILIFFIAPFWIISQAIPAEIPSHIQAIFTDLYPNIFAEKWEKDADGYYKVDFMNDSISTQLSITPAGKVYMKRIEISEAELPKIIQQEVAELFPGKQMLRAYYYMKSDSRTTYSVLMQDEAEEYFFTWDN